MSNRLLLREAPAIRELLTRATWADLDRIAARYSVVVTGRRRDLVVERLAALLEQPEQLRVAESKLADSPRLVLGLLMLLGGVDDERTLSAARDRIVAIQPALRATLGRAHLPNDLQILTSLGLCFVDRRRLVIPVEVLQVLVSPLQPADKGAPPDVQPLTYAAFAHKLTLLLTNIAQNPPAAVQAQRAAVDRVTVYQPLLLPPDAAHELGQRLAMAPPDVTLMVSLLEAMGAIAAQRGRWQVQQGWHPLVEYSPQVLLSLWISAWQQPRAFSDLGRTGTYVWRCAADVECGGLIVQHEAALRTIVWRWLRWFAEQPITIKSLCQTLAAIHPALFHVRDERETWIEPAELRRGGQMLSTEPEPVAEAVVGQLIQQLAQFGLVAADGTSCVLTPLALTVLTDRPYPHTGATITSVGADTLLVQPLAVTPTTLRDIRLAGQILLPEGEYERWQVTAEGLTKLQSAGTGIAAFEQQLLDAGAELGQDFQQRLRRWQERAGRIRLHRPLVVLLTAEDAPLAQILAAADLSGSAEILGPGCVLLEADVVDAALERLRARGFWPTTSILPGESYAVS